MKKNQYYQLQNGYHLSNSKEYYGSTISLMGSLKDIRKNLTAQCFCTETIQGKPIKKFYPVQLCNTCQS